LLSGRGAGFFYCLVFALWEGSMNRQTLLAWLWALGALFPAALVRAEAPASIAATEEPGQASAEQTRFIRLRRDDSKRPVAMETAVVRYISAQRPGVAVDLIGAVHIADRAYYDELNKLFETYEVVLYELVAPEGTRIPKGGRKEGSGHPIGALQEGMSTILELRHQLDCVDYTKSNLIHADLSPEEFNKRMEQRGESFFQMFLRLMGQGMAQSATGAGGVNDATLLMALFSKDRATRLKAAMAEQFENLDGQMAVFDGPDGSTIITERNKRCLGVLDQQLNDGKKTIAIFYGAGHLPDMERHLLADYGLKRASEKWLTAWQLQKAATESAPPANDKEKQAHQVK
jgi:hypothetical protein